MNDIFDIVLLVAKKLDSAVIPYMVSGSVAATFYAEPRFTNDVDIVIHTFRNNKNEIVKLFQDEFYITATAIDDAFNGVGIFNIIHNTSITKCDFILLKDDEFSQHAFHRAVTKQVKNYDVHIIALEDLIIQKLLWRKETESSQQWTDSKNLFFANSTIIDRNYLLEWGTKLQLAHDIEKLL